MKLPAAFNWTSAKAELERADTANQKKNEQIVVQRLIMTNTDDGKQYVITLDNTGIVATLL